jgi:hypothetical protein
MLLIPLLAAQQNSVTANLEIFFLNRQNAPLLARAVAPRLRRPLEHPWASGGR